MCLKSEYVYFSQLSGCVLSPCAHILHSLAQAGHNCLMVMTMPSVKKCHMVRHDLAWRCQFLLNCVSVGRWSQRLQKLSPPGDSYLQNSRVPWCWLCWSQRWAFCLMYFFLLLSWNALDDVKLQLCKTFAQRGNVVQLGEICIVWLWKWLFFCLCRALFQLFWFYFSCLSGFFSERAAAFAGLPLGNTKCVH